jgi:hypothetical protein
VPSQSWDDAITRVPHFRASAPIASQDRAGQPTSRSTAKIPVAMAARITSSHSDWLRRPGRQVAMTRGRRRIASIHPVSAGETRSRRTSSRQSAGIRARAPGNWSRCTEAQIAGQDPGHRLAIDFPPIRAAIGPPVSRTDDTLPDGCPRGDFLVV